MAEQPIVPINNYQAQAFAAAEAVTFTATDRKLIEERTGEVNKTRSFLDALFRKPLTPEVENEETPIRKEKGVHELQEQYRQGEELLKTATMYSPKERVEILMVGPDQKDEAKKDAPPSDKYENPKEPVLETKVETPKPINRHVVAKTIAIVRELKLDPAELFDKFIIEEKELLQLVSKIKDLHFKRLLCDVREDFEYYSEEIKLETLQYAKPEARQWLDRSLDRLSLETAKYKLNLTQSMQTIHLNDHMEKNIKWLKDAVNKLSKRAK